MKDLNDEFKFNGDLVRAYLQREDRKQSYLVKQLNMSGSFVTQMLAGKVPRDPNILKQVAQLVGVSVDELLIPKEAKRTA